MRNRHGIRASDGDRETVTERLRRAAAEGRLTTDELEHRIGGALAARTYGDLDALTADLPIGRLPVAGGRIAPARRRRRPLAVVAIAATMLVLAVLAIAALVLLASALAGWTIFAWMVLGRRPRRSLPRRRQARAVARHTRAHGYVSSFTPWL